MLTTSSRLMPLLSASAIYIGCSLLLQTAYSGSARLADQTVSSSLPELLAAGPGKTLELERLLEQRWGFPNGTQTEDWPAITKYFAKSPNPLVSDAIVSGYVKQLMAFEVQQIMTQGNVVIPEKLSVNNVKRLSNMSNQVLLQAKLQQIPKSSPSDMVAFGASKSSTDITRLQKSPETFGEDTMGLDLSQGKFFAVADGVGGAENSQVTSRVAVKAIESFLALNNISKQKLPVIPKLLQALTYATHTLLIRLQHRGSTTLTYGIVTPKKELFVTHVGDCQVLVIRNDDFVFATREQWLQPNMPNQMNSAFRLDPASVDIYSFQLQKGDIIIATSDGVADNVFPADVLEVYKRTKDDISKLAHDLVELAVRSGSGEFGMQIPFNAKLGTVFPGKRDDSTVIVVRVQ